MVSRAFDGHDLRVRKKLHARAAHGLHEIALSTVHKQDRTFQAADEGFDLTLSHRGSSPVAQNRTVLPSISPALEARPMTGHAESRLLGNQRKGLLHLHGRR